MFSLFLKILWTPCARKNLHLQEHASNHSGRDTPRRSTCDIVFTKMKNDAKITKHVTFAGNKNIWKFCINFKNVSTHAAQKIADFSNLTLRGLLPLKLFRNLFCFRRDKIKIWTIQKPFRLIFSIRIKLTFY